MNPFEKFYEIRTELAAFLGAILEGVGRPELFRSRHQLDETFKCLLERYSFIDLCYALDSGGNQICDNYNNAKLARISEGGSGIDRSHRSYYRQVLLATGSVLTAPYLSSATGEICLTAAMPVRETNGDLIGILVIDVNFHRALSLLEGDRHRKRLEPLFKLIYGLFSLGLLIISIGLFTHALAPMAQIWGNYSVLQSYTAPFQATILLTLGLAIFDLSKTIFEEEVLLSKDVRRHSATRRTLTRFIAAILIAISIETLMLVFKFAIEQPGYLREAAWLMLGAVGMLIGLGIYVFLGSKAEIALLEYAERKRNSQ